MISHFLKKKSYLQSPIIPPRCFLEISQSKKHITFNSPIKLIIYKLRMFFFPKQKRTTKMLFFFPLCLNIARFGHSVGCIEKFGCWYLDKNVDNPVCIILMALCMIHAFTNCSRGNNYVSVDEICFP